MGQGRPTGNSLGNATGRISIDVSQLEQARQAARTFATEVERSLSGLDRSTRGAEQGVRRLSGSLGDLAGVLGAGLGIRELTRYALQTNELATAYARQSVAARNLAGSQAELNALLAAYNDATGNAIDRATALSDVTRLMAVGFADNVREIDEFSRAVRGISLATGRPQEFIVTQLQMEMLNQTGLRLDQIGLSMEAVRQRAGELEAANSNLTKEQAYQNAILQIANERYGELTRSAEAQATGVEHLSRAWKEFGLTVGQVASGPVNFVAEAMANWLEDAASDVQVLTDAFVFMGQAIGVVNRNVSRFNRLPDVGAYQRDSYLGPSRRATPSNPLYGAEAGQVKLDWARGVSDINLRANRDTLEQTRQYNEQRASLERNYQQTVLREAEDFARQRARQEQDLADAIADIHSDAAQREIRMAEDHARAVGRMQRDSAERLSDLQENLERTVAQRRADSAERVAEWEEDHDKAVEERRKDSAARILELEEDFARERIKAQQAYDLARQEAASRLDARALVELDRRYNLEQGQAEQAHDDQLSEEREQLAEALRQLEEAHQERIADEARALDKSIRQANEAYERQAKDEREALAKRISDANEAYGRQLEDARAADEQRITDMVEGFEKQRAQEDIERGIRLGRQATDHENQLGEMDRQHTARIGQIQRHAADERRELDEQARLELEALGVRVDAWQKAKEAEVDFANKMWDKFWGNVTDSLTTPPPIGPSPGPGQNPSLDPRRDQLQAEIDNQRAIRDAYPPGSKEWSDASSRIIELQRQLELLDGGATPGAAAAGLVPSAPMPLVGAASVAPGNGASSVSIGGISVVVNGAPGQSVEALGAIIEQHIYNAVMKAAGAFA